MAPAVGDAYVGVEFCFFLCTDIAFLGTLLHTFLTKALFPHSIILCWYIDTGTLCGRVKTTNRKDSLAIYDGPGTTSPLLANLCGNYWLNNLPLLYSSGSQLTVVFTKSADSPSALGFTASWSTVSPCNICLYSGKGTCKAGTCVCNSKYTGSVCQKGNDDLFD